MKRVVTLDPDYVPWQAPLVKLRRKRLSKAQRFMLIALLGVLGFGGWRFTRATPAPTHTPVVVPTMGVTEAELSPLATPSPAVCPAATGQAGSLTLQYGCAATRFPCRQYTLAAQGRLAAHAGETAAGPVVVIPPELDVVRLICDDTELVFDVP